VHPSWTTEQKRAYDTARTWARAQLLPWGVANSYAGWFATVGRNLFDEQEEAFDRWTETPEYLKQADEWDE